MSIPSLASGQVATLTIPLVVDANAQVDNTLTAYASITASDALDPIMTNNADRAEIVISGNIIPVGTGIYGDLNNDGHPDLLWQRKLKLDGSKQTVVAGYLANGQGGFSSSEQVLASNTKKFSVVSIGDYNRDGFSDLFWQGKVKVAGSRKKMNVIQVSLGGVSNSFGNPIAIATNTAKFKLATSRDVNGDGIEDLLWHGKIKVEGSRKNNVACKLTLAMLMEVIQPMLS
ncbi:MAG: FG-GAP-like repeat-containing protein [Verrucomicrobiia bacterium]